jgi:hypothetical protein
MNINKKAGNLKKMNLTTCAKGVDCSGFVARVWGFTFKLGTSTIEEYVKPVSPFLTLGDVLNKYGEHVVVFQSNGPNGINTFESTHDQNFDRVVNYYRAWSALAGYKPWRSITSCL